MSIKGKVHKYGDHVDTDVIIPARYLNTSDPAELAPHAMEDLDPDFVQSVKPGDIIVAGRNFGCGSSREHAPIALQASGISAVIAHNFARIFFRNALNLGLPIIECPQAANAIDHGDEVEVDLDAGLIRDLTQGTEYRFSPLTGMAGELVEAGGLKQLVRRRVLERSRFC